MQRTGIREESFSFQISLEGLESAPIHALNVSPSSSFIEPEQIAEVILFLRGQKVMLDVPLGALYGMETGALNRAVTRNIDRFPADFMFLLAEKEFEILRCQFGISSWGGRRYLPRAFTEQEVAMLSSVLRSQRAVRVNIEIMRAFVRLIGFAPWKPQKTG